MIDPSVLPYIAQLAVFVCMFAILGISLDLLMGFGGLFSIAQAVFYGVGAYGVAIAQTRWGFGFVPAFVFGAVVAGAVGALTSFPALRLRGEYLVVASLATQIVGVTMFVNLDSVTNGPAGIVAIPAPSIGSLVLDSNESYFWFALVLLLLVLVAAAVIVRSPWGRLLRAVRDDDVATATLAKNVTLVKVTAFALSAAVAGLAGGLYADFVTFINPDSFTLDQSVLILAVLIIGGVGTLYGSVAGAIVVVVAPELIRLIALPTSVEATLDQLVYGALIVLFVMFRPQGVAAWRRTTSPPAADEDAVSASPTLAVVAPPPQAPSSNGHARMGAPIEVSGVSKAFGGMRVLRDASLSVPQGTVVAIIGPNGAGKTTLLDAITGFVRADAGEIRIHGRAMAGAGPYAVARAGAVRLFQESRIFPQMSVLENVMVGFRDQRRESFVRLWDPRPSTRRRERRMREQALALLDNVGLAGKADARASALSYGQQKLVCLVRAIATEPDVLLLDEPCVGVALPVIEQIEAFIAAARADGRTVLLVEHNLEFVGRVADTVVFMHEGQIDTVGEPETVLADERLGRLYFGVTA